MRTTIDRAGRVRGAEEAARPPGVGPGRRGRVIERDGALEIHPVSATVEIEVVDGLPVAHAVDVVPPLTDDDVRETVARLRG